MISTEHLLTLFSVIAVGNSFTIPLQEPEVLNSYSQNATKPNKTTCPDTKTLYKGKCFPVLHQFPCGDEEWLVDDNNGQGKCVKNPCSTEEGTIYFKNKCVPLRSETECPQGMRLYAQTTGVGACDCKDGHIYNNEACYPAYTQGPCRKEQILSLVNGKPKCEKNPCKEDGYYILPKLTATSPKNTEIRFDPTTLKSRVKNCKPLKPVDKPTCLKIGDPCPTVSSGGLKKLFLVNPLTNQLDCINPISPANGFNLSTRIIGNVPILKCAPGSRRDILGNCRTPTTIDFS